MAQQAGPWQLLSSQNWGRVSSEVNAKEENGLAEGRTHAVGSTVEVVDTHGGRCGGYGGGKGDNDGYGAHSDGDGANKWFLVVGRGKIYAKYELYK